MPDTDLGAIEQPSPLFLFLKKVLLIFIVFFLLFLLVGLFIFGNVFDQLAGRLDRVVLSENFTLSGPFGVVQFTPEVYMQLQEIYSQEPVNEFAVCFFGTRTDLFYVLDRLEVPVMQEQTVSHVRFSSCPAHAFVVLHRHPEDHCLFSAQDVLSHQLLRARNPHALSALLCGSREFAFLS